MLRILNNITCENTKCNLLVNPKFVIHGNLESVIDVHFQNPFIRFIFVSVKNSDKRKAIPLCRDLIALGYKILATGGTHDYLAEKGIESKRMRKVKEGQPHIVDAIIK